MNRGSFEIIFYRMEEEEGLQLQLIETTAVSSHSLNRHCFFDGSTLVYLAGAHIVMHNVFQNTKQFVERLSEGQVQAMSFQTSTELGVALASKHPCTQVQFYSGGKRTAVVELNEELQVSDLIFLQKKRICLLAYSAAMKQSSLIMVSSNKKVRKVELPERGYSLACNDIKLYILTESGCLQFSLEGEVLEKKKCYSEFRLSKILIDESETEILFDYKGNCGMAYQDGIKWISLGGQCQTAVRIAGGMLVALKGEFALLHFQIERERLELAGRYELSDRGRGGIVDLHKPIDELSIALAVQTQHKESWKTQHYLFNLSALSSEKKFISPFLKLQTGGNAGDVSHLQATIPAQIFCLSGAHVLNYSYVEQIEKKHKYSIHESPRSIAVHPLGHQLFCTFETAAKFYQKVEMELVEIWSEAFICSAARYTESGLLVLCLLEDCSYNIVVYNPNSFRRLRAFTGLYLKHAVTRIELDEAERELILYCQKDLFVFLFSTGEKISEFRERREVGEAGCIEYDSARKQLLVANKLGLLVCRKTEEYLLNFSHQKQVVIRHQITAICISETSQTVFLGTSTGVVLFGKYPIEIEEEETAEGPVQRGKLSSVKIHCQPLSELKLTHNCRFLFAAIRGDGLSILRLRRIGGSLKGYSPFDVSNYNFIQTSSSPYLEQLQQRLKNLLQKRKAIFNELDEFKKEWESKRQAETKGLAITNKHRQLASVNTALSEIGRSKVEQAALQEELACLQTRAENTLAEEEKAHYSKLLALYEQNDRLSIRLQEVEGKCQGEWDQVQDQTAANLEQIRNELEAKFITFEENYRMMRANLVASRRRVEIDQEEEKAVREEELQDWKQQLFAEEESLYARSNELKGEITRSRKELQRFSSRKDFLENKKRFFEEQLKFCSQERVELADVRETLEEELAELESVTHKKERRLRKYFLENEMLIKYQLIHDNLTRQSGRETEVLEQQHTALRSKIGALQREILAVSEQRQAHCRDLEGSKRELFRAKHENQSIRQKREFLEMQVRQIEGRVALANSGRPAEESRNEEFIAIYEEYFQRRGLEAIVNSGETQNQELLASEKKKSDEGVKAVLVDHKEYLTENMKLFERYNSKVMEEISLTYLKHQTSNYDLISECNLRKQQINRKKRVLHELVDSLRATSAQIASLAQPESQSVLPTSAQPNSALPFTLYEQEKAELRKEKSESGLWKMKKSSYQVRKMLEVQRLKGRGEGQRRIQTAKLKKKAEESSHEECLEQSSPIHYLPKPQTAVGRQGSAGRMLSRNKSESKPTTCTSHGRSKYSHFS